MYKCALLILHGKPEEGSAESEELELLKSKGYTFRKVGDDVHGYKPCKTRYYSGRDVLNQLHNK